MTEKPKVYFGSIYAGRTARFANLSEKLNKILEQLDLSSIEEKDKVAIKMHLGFNDGYQTVPVFFVRRIVDAVKKQGGFPFVTDNPTAVYNAAERGYTAETCGCPIVPIAGIKDGYKTDKEVDFKGIDKLSAAGALLDADVLINLAHAKGHGACGYGGVFKNIALGGYSGPSRWYKIHGVVHYDKFFDKDKMTKEHMMKLREACPRDAPTWNEQKDEGTMAFYNCDQCHGAEPKPCIEADGGLTGWSINPENFNAFQELMARAAKIVLDSFDKNKLFHINVMMDITPFCDCMGMGMPSVIDDIGILGSRDIVAADIAALDLMAKTGLNERMVRNIPEMYLRANLEGDDYLHPLQKIHGPLKNPYLVARYGEEIGLGSSEYELVELLAAEETAEKEPPKHVYESGPTFF